MSADARSASPATAPARLDALILALLLLVALIPRLYFVLELHPPDLYLKWDMANYDHLADRIREGLRGPWDTYIPPGYPAFLACIYGVAGKSYRAVGVVQAVLSAAAAVMAYPLARRLHGSRVVAFVVAAAMAAHLPLIVYSGFLLSESVFVFLATSFALLLVVAHDRRSTAAATAAGIAFALGCAVRPNLVLATPLLAALALGRSRRVRFALANAFVVAAPLLLAVAARNTLAAGRPAFLATNGGINFYMAHVRVGRVLFDPADPVTSAAGYHNRHRYTEVVATGHHSHDEAYLYREGMREIGADPGAAVVEVGRNFEDGVGLGPQGTWPDQAFWPGWMGHDEGMNGWGRAGFFFGVLPAMLWALGRRVLPRGRRREDPARGPRRMLLALASSVLVAVALLSGDPRVRVSFDPIFFVLASEPLARALAYVTRRRAAPTPRDAHAAA